MLMQLELYCHTQMNDTVVSLICAVSSQNIQMYQHASELKQPVRTWGDGGVGGLSLKMKLFLVDIQLD